MLHHPNPDARIHRVAYAEGRFSGNGTGLPGDTKSDPH